MTFITIWYGPPWWLSGKGSACQYRKPGFTPGSGRSLEKEMVTGIARKYWRTTILATLVEPNGNHSSILAWKILSTEELGRLQSMGLQKRWP